MARLVLWVQVEDVSEDKIQDDDPRAGDNEMKGK